MSDKNADSRLRIAQSYVELVDAMPTSKITANMIAKNAGIHRMTFYCHFTGKEELTIWILRCGLARVLRAEFSEDELVYDSDEKAFCAEFPFYARRFDESGGIDDTQFFTGAFLQRMIRSLKTSHPLLDNEDIAPFENVMHDAMSLLVERCAR